MGIINKEFDADLKPIEKSCKKVHTKNDINTVLKWWYVVLQYCVQNISATNFF
jgi:hypothetical protein